MYESSLEVDKTDPDYWRSRLSVGQNKYPTRSGPGGKAKYLKSFQQRMKKVKTYSESRGIDLGGHSPRDRELKLNRFSQNDMSNHLKRSSEYVETPFSYDM